MSTDTKQIVSKAWNFAHLLRGDDLKRAGRQNASEPATGRQRQTPRRDRA